MKKKIIARETFGGGTSCGPSKTKKCLKMDSGSGLISTQGTRWKTKNTEIHFFLKEDLNFCLYFSVFFSCVFCVNVRKRLGILIEKKRRECGGE